MSQRARGLEAGEKDGNVVSGLSGTFKLRDGSLSSPISRSRFPARKCSSRALTASVAKLSTLRVARGWTRRFPKPLAAAIKGFFLKAIDPLFKKKGAGALIPIKIGGTKDKPAFGLDVGRVFNSK